MISTVLPTPAPPNRPILPPFAYGARRSTTLMPVTRISASVDCSVYSGAGWWMPRSSVDLIGPASSTGSPMTFMMRPSVPSPTGTAIGRPVSVTSWPRARPSGTSLAIVRTVDSPRCWATSSTRRLPPFLVSSELRMAGRWPSNCTSTTAPMTWGTRPTWLAAVAITLSPSIAILSRVSVRPLDRLGAGDDLDQLLGDHRLAGAVINQRLLADHLAGVAGGVVHGRHLRAIERGVILEQRAKHL